MRFVFFALGMIAAYYFIRTAPTLEQIVLMAAVSGFGVLFGSNSR